MSYRDTGAFRALDEGTKPGMWRLILTVIVCVLALDHLGATDFIGVAGDHVGSMWQETMKHAKDLALLLTAVAGLVSAWRGRNAP